MGEWVDAGQGWQATETSVRLQGWSWQRRIIVLRRRVKGALAASSTDFKYYYIPVPPNGIAGIVVEPTEELFRLQQELLDAVAPFTEKTGTAAAFVSVDGGRDIQQGLIDYVANFSAVGVAAATIGYWRFKSGDLV